MYHRVVKILLARMYCVVVQVRTVINPSETTRISAIELAELEMLEVAQGRHAAFFHNQTTHRMSEKTSTNPFPGLCLSNRGDCEKRSGNVKLSIQIDDPELAFVFRRHAAYDGVSVEEYCTKTLLQVLECEEDQFQRDIDPATGLIVD
jgi:hypothetical protein